MSQTSSPVAAGAVFPDPFEDFPDVVATQGAYLVSRGSTPVLREPDDGDFAYRLELRLNALLTVQHLRRSMYREVADEYPRGRTPPEAREAYEARMKALEALLDLSSDEESNDDDGDHKGKNIRAMNTVRPGAAERRKPDEKNPEEGPETPAASSQRPPQTKQSKQPKQPPVLPLTPVESPPSAPESRKRRRAVEEDDDEEKQECRSKRKRNEEPPRKVRTRATPIANSRNMWLKRLRPRGPRQLAS